MASMKHLHTLHPLTVNEQLGPYNGHPTPRCCGEGDPSVGTSVQMILRPARSVVVDSPMINDMAQSRSYCN